MPRCGGPEAARRCRSHLGRQSRLAGGALFFHGWPAFSDPLANRFVVAFSGAPRWPLQRPAHCAHDSPDMPRVILHPPVTRSMTCATRGRVHKSVLNPCARAPSRNAAATCFSCSACRRGARPARPPPRRAFVPPPCHCANHRLTLCRLTRSWRATDANRSPTLNNRAARFRRCSSP